MMSINGRAADFGLVNREYWTRRRFEDEDEDLFRIVVVEIIIKMTTLQTGGYEKKESFKFIQIAGALSSAE